MTSLTSTLLIAVCTHNTTFVSSMKVLMNAIKVITEPFLSDPQSIKFPTPSIRVPVYQKVNTPCMWLWWSKPWEPSCGNTHSIPTDFQITHPTFSCSTHIHFNTTTDAGLYAPSQDRSQGLFCSIIKVKLATEKQTKKVWWSLLCLCVNSNNIQYNTHSEYNCCKNLHYIKNVIKFFFYCIWEAWTCSSMASSMAMTLCTNQGPGKQGLPRLLWKTSSVFEAEYTQSPTAVLQISSRNHPRRVKLTITAEGKSPN